MPRHYTKKPKPKRPEHGVDPWQVLASIAGDENASPTARVAAAKAMISREVAGEEPAPEDDAVEAAVRLLAERNRNAKR